MATVGTDQPDNAADSQLEEILAANGVGIYDDKGTYTDSAVGMLTTLALLEGVYSFAALARVSVWKCHGLSPAPCLPQTSSSISTGAL